MSIKHKAAAILIAITSSCSTTITWGRLPACQDGWSFENITVQSGGPLIEGKPFTFSWHQSGVGKRDEIFARSRQTGYLAHYYRVQNGPWLGGELSHAPGSASPLIHDPVVVQGSQTVQNAVYNRHDVFTVDDNQDLIHYWWSEIPPAAWHAENLTAIHHGPKVLSKPVIRNSYYSGGLFTEVFSISLDGDLIRYWWTSQDGWNSDNITRNINGDRFGFHATRQPSIFGSSQLGTNLFGTNSAGQLLHYWRPENDWHWDWTNATEVNGIPTYPTITSNTIWHSPILGDPGVFGFSGTDLIRYHWVSYPNSWSADNLTTTFGFNGSSGRITGKPVMDTSLQATTNPNGILIRQDVFARDSNDDLIHYWAATPNYMYPNPMWRPGENLTTKINGHQFNSNPTMAIHGDSTDNPRHYVFGRSGTNQLVNYCWNRSDGWSSRIMQRFSIPRGRPVSHNSPAVTESSTVGLSVYAVGSGSVNGDLLHFWKAAP